MKRIERNTYNSLPQSDMTWNGFQKPTEETTEEQTTNDTTTKRLKEDKTMKREEIITKIEHDNERRILFQTAMPHVLDILNKYNGKQYGEKTKQKMSNELKEKCNCALYLYNGWHEDISIVPLNVEGFTNYHFRYSDFNIYVKYPKRDSIRPLGNDNKIHGGFSFEDFTLSDCHEYVYDVAAHADNIIASFEVLKERQEELQRNITIFNNMLPSGIENRHITTFRNYL